MFVFKAFSTVLSTSDHSCKPSSSRMDSWPSLMTSLSMWLYSTKTTSFARHYPTSIFKTCTATSSAPQLWEHNLPKDSKIQYQWAKSHHFSSVVSISNLAHSNVSMIVSSQSKRQWMWASKLRSMRIIWLVCSRTAVISRECPHRQRIKTWPKSPKW